MADRRFLMSSLSQLNELAKCDEERLTDAQDRVRVAQARAAEAEVRVEASRRAVQAVQTRLDRLVRVPEARTEQAPADTDEHPVPVVDLIRAFLGEREEATTAEIIVHVRRTRPQANSSSVNPELSRLVKRRHIVRVKTGVYRLSDDREADRLPNL